MKYVADYILKLSHHRESESFPPALKSNPSIPARKPKLGFLNLNQALSAAEGKNPASIFRMPASP